MKQDTADMKRRHSLYEARHCGYEKRQSLYEKIHSGYRKRATQKDEVERDELMHTDLTFLRCGVS